MPARRHRSSRRSSGTRRKGHWESFFFSVDNAGNTWNGRDTITFWAKWPGHVVDDSQQTFPINWIPPQDETWTRVMCRPQVEADSTGLGGPILHYKIAMGLIAWQSTDPEDMNLVIFPDGDRAPNALDGTLDWIWRVEYVFVVKAGLGFSSTDPSDTISMSRAQRKLSDAWGVLACISAATADDDDITNDIAMDLTGRMFIKNAK